MRTVYIEPVSFHCYPTQNADGNRIPFEHVFFNDKCDTFIMGYRVVPKEHTWIRDDGVSWEKIEPWKPYDELKAAQAQYERDQAELLAAYQEGVNSV